jgi:TPR repeat protein
MKKLIIAVLIVLLSSVSTLHALDLLTDAKKAYEEGNYSKSLEIIRPLALAKNPDAQTKLGVLYENGHGVTQDYAEAMKWYKLAAAQDYSKAQGRLGLLYFNGKGVTQDYVEALKWYKLAVKKGDATSQNNLGVLYASEKAGVRNDVEAMKWFKLAAEKGYKLAQLSLGAMYFKNDSIKSFMWIALSLAHGNEKLEGEKSSIAKELLDSLAKEMSASEISEAQRLAFDCQIKKYKGC